MSKQLVRVTPPVIPAIRSDKDIKTALENIRGFFKSVVNNGGIMSVQDMIDTTLVDTSLKPSPSTTFDSIIPPKIENFTATGAFRTIILSWDTAAMNPDRLLRYELFRATVDNFSDAVHIADIWRATVYSDAPSNASLSITYYYWIRAVSTSGKVGPINSTAGTPASTANDPAYMLEVLENQLTESQLHGDLTSRIDLIDTPIYGLVDRMIAAEAGIQTALASGIQTVPFDENELYSVGELVSWNNSIYKNIQDINSTPAPAPSDDTYWELIGNYATLADMVSAMAAGVESLDTRVDTAEDVLTAHASDISSLLATVDDAETGVVATSQALTTLTARVTNTENTNTSQANSITALQSTVNNPTTGVAATASALSTLTTRVTNVEGVNTTQASAISTLQTTVGGHTTSIQTNATAIDGIQGKYTVKIDNNGYVTGYGLISSANNGTPTSEFMVVADKFSIAPVATNGDAADGSPFFHLTTTTTVGGVSLPAGTYMKKAFITDLTSSNIRAASIAADRLNVTLLSSISANLGTVTAGDMWAARYDSSATHSGKRIDINYTTSGEITFYGDRGDGTIDTMSTIGIANIGADYYVGVFGNLHSGNSRIGLFAGSYSNYGFYARSEQQHAAYFLTNGSGKSAIYGISNGANGYGAMFFDEATGGTGAYGRGGNVGVLGSGESGYGVYGLGGQYGGVFNAGSYGSIKIGSRTSNPVGEAGGMYFNSIGNGMKIYSRYISSYDNDGYPIWAGPSWVYISATTSIG